jgi:hypothetical protein
MYAPKATEVLRGRTEVPIRDIGPAVQSLVQRGLTPVISRNGIYGMSRRRVSPP